MEKTSRFDFAGFRLFGELAAMLASGREPSVSDWDALFAVPGYIALTRSEFSRDVIIDRMRLACLPERATERDAMLAANKSEMLAHMVDVRRRWPELEAAAARIAASELQSEAVALACRWLPAGRLATPGEALPECPPVSFLIFLKDARGYEPVVFDVAAAAEMTERELTLILAHEFHHYYRNRLLAFDRAAAPRGSEDLLWVLDQIHAEGVADLINVPETVYGNGPWAAGAGSLAYRAEVDSAPQFLARLDNDLTQISRVVASGRLVSEASGAESAISAVARDLKQALPRSGHPIGYYMASFVARGGCETELIRTVGDPLAFFALYQCAASAANLPMFNCEACSALAWLEERCAR